MKKSLFLIPLFLLSGLIYSYSQSEADSLKKLLENAEGKERIKVLLELSKISQKTDPLKTFEYATEALKLSKDINEKENHALSLQYIGNAYGYTAKMDSALLYFKKSLNIYEELEDHSQIAAQLRNIGVAYRWLSYYDSAIEYTEKAIYQYELLENYIKIADCKQSLADIAYIQRDPQRQASLLREALELVKEYEDPLTEMYIYSSLGNLFHALGNFDEAMEYFLKALKLYEQGVSEPGTNPVEYVNIALILSKQGEHEAAIEYLKRHEEIVSQFNRQQPLISNKLTLVSVYVDMGLYDTAHIILQDVIKFYRDTEQLFQLQSALMELCYINSYMKEYDALYTTSVEGLQLSEEMNDYVGISVFYSQLGMYYKAKKNYEKALHYLSMFVDRMKKIKSFEPTHLGYSYISSCYEENGKPDSALHYYKLSQQYYDSVKRESMENKIAGLHIQYESELKENQIAMLESDKEINELKVVQSRNINIGIGALFIILIMMGLIFIRQNKLKNEHQSTLLEQKLLRLQMNPHFIFNALSSIHSLMNPRDVNKASDYLGNFSRLLRSSLESSREDYILLEEEISSIKNYLELQQLRYEKKFDYKIDVDPKIDLESAILPPMLLQPFIENAIEHGVKHKEAKGHIRIRFKLENKKLTCEIEDDGVGREKAWEVEYAKKGKHKSLATEIIHDRIKILNKKLKQNISLNIADLKSEANEAIGTLVMLDLPYLID